MPACTPILDPISEPADNGRKRGKDGFIPTFKYRSFPSASERPGICRVPCFCTLQVDVGQTGQITLAVHRAAGHPAGQLAARYPSPGLPGAPCARPYR